MTLTEFLLARIAEDEMRECVGSGEYRDCYVMSDEFVAHAKARRRIVELHAAVPVAKRYACEECRQAHPCPTALALGLPYAEHADYREEWRP